MPKQVDADQRRAELADAAAHVIARSGIDGASLRSVAAEAGWTTGALVHYFANKRELLAFTLQTSLERRRSRHADRSSLPADEALRIALHEGLPTTDATRLHWTVTLAFAAQASADPELAVIQRDAYRHFRASIAELVDTLGRHDDAIEEAERLIGVLDGISIQAIFDPESWPPERQRRALDAGMSAASPATIV